MNHLERSNVKAELKNEQWEAAKAELRTLYINQDHTLDEVMKSMASRGFRVSYVIMSI